MSVKYHDLNVGVTLGGGGGGSTIIPKTITANGTYNASADNADGYDPVIVSVGGDPDIPTGYTKIPAVWAKGDVYIDTGVYPTAEHTIEVVGMLVSGSGYNTIFGCRNGNASRFTMRFNSASSGSSSALGTQYSVDAGASATLYDTSFRRPDALAAVRPVSYKMSKNVAYVDGTEVHTFSSPTGTTPFPYKTFIFANNNAGSPGDYASMISTGAKIWDETGTLVRKFVPVIDSNGVAGMFETVNQVFYSGSGSGFFRAIME